MANAAFGFEKVRGSTFTNTLVDDAILYFNGDTQSIHFGSKMIDPIPSMFSVTNANGVAETKFHLPVDMESNALFRGDVRVQGELKVDGTTTTIDTNLEITDRLSVINDGTGPAFIVDQIGPHQIATFMDDGVPVLSIKDGGNVGIGTDAPAKKLHVVGDILVSSDIDVTENLEVGGNLTVLGDSATFDTTLLSTSGSVGIGTNAPEQKLHVEGSIYATSNLQVDGDTQLNGDLNVQSNILMSTEGSLGVGTLNPIEKVEVIGNVKATYFIGDGSRLENVTASTSDVIGPSSSTDNGITRFDGVSGKIIQDSPVTMSDEGAIVAPQASSIIPFYHETIDSFPSASTYHGAIAHAHDTGNMYYAHGGEWKQLANNNILESVRVNAAATTLDVANNASSAYTFSPQYAGDDNPTLNIVSGATVAFNFEGLSPEHPFHIRNTSGTDYNEGLLHVANDGTVSLGQDAQGKVSGILFWRVPAAIRGTYRYQCSAHAAMVGDIDVFRSVDNVIQSTNSNVGIGTDSPSEKLHVVGNALITGNIEATDAELSGNLTVNGDIVTLNSDVQMTGQFTLPEGAVSITNTGVGPALRVQQSVDEPVVQLFNGDNNVVTVSSNVGIGTDAPLEKLHVEGNALITGNIEATDAQLSGNLTVNGETVTLNSDVQMTGQFTLPEGVVSITNTGVGPALRVQQSVDEPVVQLFNGDNNVVTVSSNVGIGTDAPLEKLHVVGTVKAETFIGDGSQLTGFSTSADVKGPASALDDAVARFDGTTGKLLDNSLVTINDSGVIRAPSVGSLIPSYFPDLTSFPSASTYHGAIAHAHIPGYMYYAHGGEWKQLANQSILDVYRVNDAATTFAVANNSSSAYTFSPQYAGDDNPTLNIVSGATVAFNFEGLSPEHPFHIRNASSQDYNEGLLHVAIDGTVSLGQDAQGKVSGILFWRVPAAIRGTYRYQCSSHAAMVGDIEVFRTVDNVIQSIDSNVGIGTDSPTEKLHVEGSIYTTGNIQVDGNTQVDGNLTTNSLLTVGDDATFDSNVLVAGNIGIGTDAPTRELHLVGNALITGNIEATDTQLSGNLTVNGETVTLNSDVQMTGQFTLPEGVVSITNTGVGPALRVQQSVDEPVVQLFNGDNNVVTVSSNVGIGTDAPLEKLHVVGNALITGEVQATDAQLTGNLTVDGNTTTLNSDVLINGEFSLLDGSVSIYNSGTGPALSVDQDGEEDIAHFQQGDASILKIIDGGNVGIGIETPTEKLHVVGNALITGNIEATDTQLSGNLTVNGDTVTLNSDVQMTGQFTLPEGTVSITNTGAGPALRVKQSVDEPVVQLFNGDNNVVTVSSNVGIGTDAPLEKLHVVGKILGTGDMDVKGSVVVDQNLTVGGFIFTDGGITITSGSTPEDSTIQQPVNDVTIDGNLLVNGDLRVTTGTNVRLEQDVLMSGKLGLGTDNPQERLHVVGIALISGDVQATNASLTGNLTVNGSTTTLNSDVDINGEFSLSNGALSIYNSGTGPALSVNQAGTEDIAHFQQGDASILRIIDGGNVGIGTGAPAQKLHVEGNALLTGNVEATNADFTGSLTVGVAPTDLFGNLHIHNQMIDPDLPNPVPSLVVEQNSDALIAQFIQNGQQMMSIESGGNVGIGLEIGSLPSERLHVVGSILVSQEVIAESDRRVKDDIKLIENGLDKVEKMNGYTFTKMEIEENVNVPKKRMGVIAQELLEIIPEVVHYDESADRYSVAYGNIVGVLIEGIKDLSKEVKCLSKRVERVESLGGL